MRDKSKLREHFAVERRASPRVPLDVPATLVFGVNGCITIECRVVDLSVGGAKVETSIVTDNQNSAILKVGNDGPRAVKQCWKANEYLGVAFVDI